jgi:hypothetical protein
MSSRVRCFLLTLYALMLTKKLMRNKKYPLASIRESETKIILIQQMAFGD